LAKKKLIDNFYRDWNEQLLPLEKLTESKIDIKLKEGVQTYQDLIGYRVPLWRLDQRNLNNRIYSKKEGLRVAAKYGKNATFALFDHDEGKPSTKDIGAVAKNPQVLGDILYIDVYIIDEAFSLKLEKALFLGASLGVSSVFDGDIDDAGYVFDLELDRWCDLVMVPSYEVYITPSSPRVTPTGEVLKESNLNKPIIESKENSVKSNLTELNLEFGKLIESAKSIVNLDERKAKLKVIESYIEDEDRARLPIVVASIKEAYDVIKTEQENLLKIKENESLEIKNKLQESAEVSKNLEEEIKVLREELDSKNKVIESMEVLSKALKETNIKQQEILKAVADPKTDKDVVEEGCDGKQKLYDKDNTEVKESLETNKADVNHDTIVDANNNADLSLVDYNVADPITNVTPGTTSEENKVKEGLFSGHKCKVLEEVIIDNAKILKIELVEAKVILENIPETSVEFKEGDNLKDNEIATLQAALKKEKEQNKLLRSQLEKQKESVQEGAEGIIDPALPEQNGAVTGAVEDPTVIKEGAEGIIDPELPVQTGAVTGAVEDPNVIKESNDGSEDDSDMTDAEKAKNSVKESVNVTSNILDNKSMNHFDEKVSTANVQTIREAVEEILTKDPALATYKSSLVECTTYDQLQHTIFKLNGIIKREALDNSSFKESFSNFKPSYSYGNDDGTALGDLA